VVCSRWEEPFGRSRLEAAANGCAVIISNKGGLPETISDGVIIDNLTAGSIYSYINELILNFNKRINYQKSSYK
jgi:Glycosyltransferase